MNQKAFHGYPAHQILEVHGYVSPPAHPSLSSVKPPAFEGIQNILTNWLQSRFGDNVEEMLRSGQDFSYRDKDNNAVLEVTCDENNWAFRALYPLQGGRLWATEAALARQPTRKNKANFRVSLDVEHKAIMAEGETRNPPYRYPDFLRNIAAEYHLVDNQRPLAGKAFIVKGAEPARDLAEEIKVQNFRQPVLLFVEPVEVDPKDKKKMDARDAFDVWQRWSANVDPRIAKFAQNVAGLAHVFVVHSSASYVMKEVLDDIEPGEIRIYAPRIKPDKPFTVYSAPKNRDRGWNDFFGDFLPFRLAQTSNVPDYSPQKTPSPFLKTQEKLLAQRHVSGLIEDKAITTADFIVESLINITERLEQIEAEKAQTLSKAQEEGRIPSFNYEAYAGEIERYISQISEFRTRDEALTSLIHMECEKARDLHASFLGAHYGITKPYKQRYEELAVWVEKNFGNQIVLSNDLKSALKDPKTAKYRDISLVYAAVELLAKHGREMMLASDAGNKTKWDLESGLFTNHLGKLSLKHDTSLAPANTRNAKLRREHTESAEGEEFFLNQRLWQGTSHDSNKDFRLYYGWDNKRKRIVLGGSMSHKRNTLRS